MTDLTPEESRTIAALHRLAKTWPRTLWLYSASGNLHVMRCGPDGGHLMDGDSVDQRASLTTIKIPNDGGDW